MVREKSPYQYQPLSRGWYIRLMYIEPLDSNDPVSLLKVNLIEKHLRTTIFDALSYVWGDQDQKVPISCNGYVLSIGRNLHEALMEYRRRGGIGGLWADAICINQGCETEKTQQVRMMKEIYSAACRTIIWLGQLQPDDEKGIHLATLIYAQCRNDDYNHQRDGLGSTDFDCVARGIPDVLDDRPGISPFWSALFNILIHPWFSRVWIVQELLVSRSPEMWRGDKSMSPDIVLSAALLVGGKRDLIAFFGLNHDSSQFPAQSVAICRHKYRVRDYTPLWSTMGFTIGMEATDTRDRFFALAGISTGDLSEFVDYSRTLEQVACQVGLMSLLGTPEYQMMDGLDSLADHPSLRLRSHQTRISSWIPDLLSKSSMGFELCFVYSTPRFRSLKSTKFFPFPEIRILTEDSGGEPQPLATPCFPYFYHKIRETWIKAIVFDKVKMVLPLIVEKETFFQGNQPSRTSTEFFTYCFERLYQYSVEIIQFIHKARFLADPKLTTNDDIMSGSFFAVFWRTLIYNRAGDDARDEEQPHEWIGNSFLVWYLLHKLCLTKGWTSNHDLFVKQYRVLTRLSHPFMQAFDRMHGSRSFFVTEGGRIGWAPPDARPGDVVATFWGNRIPFIARTVKSGAWEYVGGCYVHGCMDGELTANVNESEWDFMRFV